MPEVIPTSIKSVSSESEDCPASNLLKRVSYSKWQVSENIGKSEAIIFQLPKSIMITRLDVGNNGSALIEVQVKKSVHEGDEGFKCLIPATSFMTPSDANANKNLFKVRVFTSESFNNDTAKQEYDVVKVICSQPFSKVIKFGLSFIKIFTKSNEEENENPVSSNLNLSDNNTKSEESVSKNKEMCKKLQESLLTKLKHENSSQKTQFSTSVNSVSMSSFIKTDDDSKKESPAKKNFISLLKESIKAENGSPKRNSENCSPKRSRPDKDEKKKKRNKKPLESVTFALSGYQNPTRGQLREMGVDLGASYSQDWTQSCTHLICAYGKTPKFQQVNGKGIIVSDRWLRECHRTRLMEPWRMHRLARALSPKGERFKQFDLITKRSSSDDSADSDYRLSDEEDLSNSPKRLKTGKLQNIDPYDMDTDEEEVDGNNSSVKESSKSEKIDPPIKSSVSKKGGIFKNLKIFIHAAGQTTDEHETLREVVTFNSANLCESITEDLDCFISNGPWDAVFQEAFEKKQEVHFVKPSWIFACLEKEKKLPFKDYLV